MTKEQTMAMIIDCGIIEIEDQARKNKNRHALNDAYVAAREMREKLGLAPVPGDRILYNPDF